MSEFDKAFRPKQFIGEVTQEQFDLLTNGNVQPEKYVTVEKVCELFAIPSKFLPGEDVPQELTGKKI